MYQASSFVGRAEGQYWYADAFNSQTSSNNIFSKVLHQRTPGYEAMQGIRRHEKLPGARAALGRAWATQVMVDKSVENN